MTASPESLGLQAHWVAELADIFNRLAPGYEVWAHGSRVKGQAHAGSDLDLVLIHPTQPDTVCPRWASLLEAITESNIPIGVDVLDWARVPADFQPEINRNRVRLL